MILRKKVWTKVWPQNTGYFITWDDIDRTPGFEREGLLYVRKVLLPSRRRLEMFNSVYIVSGSERAPYIFLYDFVCISDMLFTLYTTWLWPIAHFWKIREGLLVFPGRRRTWRLQRIRFRRWRDSSLQSQKFTFGLGWKGWGFLCFDMYCICVLYLSVCVIQAEIASYAFLVTINSRHKFICSVGYQIHISKYFTKLNFDLVVSNG